MFVWWSQTPYWFDQIDIDIKSVMSNAEVTIGNNFAGQSWIGELEKKMGLEFSSSAFRNWGCSNSEDYKKYHWTLNCKCWISTFLGIQTWLSANGEEYFIRCICSSDYRKFNMFKIGGSLLRCYWYLWMWFCLSSWDLMSFIYKSYKILIYCYHQSSDCHELNILKLVGCRGFFQFLIVEHWSDAWMFPHRHIPSQGIFRH